MGESDEKLLSFSYGICSDFHKIQNIRKSMNIYINKKFKEFCIQGVANYLLKRRLTFVPELNGLLLSWEIEKIKLVEQSHFFTDNVELKVKGNYQVLILEPGDIIPATIIEVKELILIAEAFSIFPVEIKLNKPFSGVVGDEITFKFRSLKDDGNLVVLHGKKPTLVSYKGIDEVENITDLVPDCAEENASHIESPVGPSSQTGSRQGLENNVQSTRSQNITNTEVTQETTTGQTATTTSFVDKFHSFIQLSQTNTNAKEQDVCGGSSMDDVATVQGSSPRNKRAHSSDPGARAKRPRLTNLKRSEGTVMTEPRLIDFEDPTDPVVLAVSGIEKVLGKYNIPDGWTRMSKPGGHTVNVAPDGTMYRSSTDKSVMQHAILQNLDYYGWAKKDIKKPRNKTILTYFVEISTRRKCQSIGALFEILRGDKVVPALKNSPATTTRKNKKIKNNKEVQIEVDKTIQPDTAEVNDGSATFSNTPKSLVNKKKSGEKQVAKEKASATNVKKIASPPEIISSVGDEPSKITEKISKATKSVGKSSRAIKSSSKTIESVDKDSKTSESADEPSEPNETTDEPFKPNETADEPSKPNETVEESSKTNKKSDKSSKTSESTDKPSKTNDSANKSSKTTESAVKSSNKNESTVKSKKKLASKAKKLLPAASSTPKILTPAGRSIMTPALAVTDEEKEMHENALQVLDQMKLVGKEKGLKAGKMLRAQYTKSLDDPKNEDFDKILMRVLCAKDIQFGPIRPSSTENVETSNSSKTKSEKKNNKESHKNSEKAVTKVSKLKRSKRCEATAESKTIPAVGDKAENNAETSANDGSEAAEGSEGVTTLGYYLSQKKSREEQGYTGEAPLMKKKGDKTLKQTKLAFNKKNLLMKKIFGKTATDKENIDPKQRTNRQQTNATNDISTVADILEHFEEAAGTENLPPNYEKSAVSDVAPKCCESADGSDSDKSDESDLNLENTTGMNMNETVPLRNGYIEKIDPNNSTIVFSQHQKFFDESKVMNDLSNLMDDTDPMDKDKDDANELEFANQYDSQGNFAESNEIIPATQQPAIIRRSLSNSFSKSNLEKSGGKMKISNNKRTRSVRHHP